MGQCLSQKPSRSLSQHKLPDEDPISTITSPTKSNTPYHIPTKFSRHSFDGSVICATEEGFIQIYSDIENGTMPRISQIAASQDATDATAVSCSPNGTLLAGFRNGNVQMYQWDGASFALSHAALEHKFAIFSIEINPSLPQFVSGGRDQIIRLWDLNTYRVTASRHIPRNLINDYCWLTAHTFIQVGEDKRIRLLDSRDLQNTAMTWNNSMIITSCDVRPGDSHQFLVTQKGSTSACSVFVHDVRKPDEVVREITGHEQGIICGRYLSSEVICSASNDRTVRVWCDNGDTAQFSIGSAPTAMAAHDGSAIVSCLEGVVRVHPSNSTSDSDYTIDQW